VSLTHEHGPPLPHNVTLDTADWCSVRCYAQQERTFPMAASQVSATVLVVTLAL
jgi:hypothetical protein